MPDNGRVSYFVLVISYAIPIIAFTYLPCCLLDSHLLFYLLQFFFEFGIP